MSEREGKFLDVLAAVLAAIILGIPLVFALLVFGWWTLAYYAALALLSACWVMKKYKQWEQEDAQEERMQR